MKKKVLSLAPVLVMVLVLGLAVPAFAATPVSSSGATHYVEKTSTSPTIDGTVEDVWGDPVLQLKKNEIAAYGWTATNDSNYCDIDYYCLWDDENIYIAFVVQEPQEYKLTDGTPFSEKYIYYHCVVELNGSGLTMTDSDFRTTCYATKEEIIAGEKQGAALNPDMKMTRTVGDSTNQIVFELRLPLSVTGVTEGKDYFDGWFGFWVRGDKNYFAIQKSVPSNTYDRFFLAEATPVLGEDVIVEATGDTISVKMTASPFLGTLTAPATAVVVKAEGPTWARSAP